MSWSLPRVLSRNGVSYFRKFCSSMVMFGARIAFLILFSCIMYGSCFFTSSTGRKVLPRVTCRMVPLSAKQVRPLVPKTVSVSQWISYWGNNPTERIQKVLESLLIAYGGAWLSWFLSFMSGSLVSAIVGTFLIFNWIYTPWITARRKNSLIWPRQRTLNYALYTGRIRSLERVRRRAGKTVGGVFQEFLQVEVDDEKGRCLEIVTQWQRGYSQLRVGMRCESLVASRSRDFEDLSAVTDIWVPSTNIWLGDYPYLDRPRFTRLVSILQAKDATARGDGSGTRPRASSGSGSGSGSAQTRQPLKTTPPRGSVSHS